MATELFKETMQELKDDYIEYAKSLNEDKGVNPLSLKLSLLEYSQLYVDFYSVHSQIQEEPYNDDETYPEDKEDQETY